MGGWVALAALLVGIIATPARAADAVTPVDGQIVDSRPQFVFDFSSGAAMVELSLSSDVTTSGDNPGKFVEPAEDDFILIGPWHDLPAGMGQPWESRRIPAGRYFWHVKADAYEDESPVVWSPTRTLVVEDEPAVFEGWTVRARRVKAQRSCRRRVLVEGSIVWSDNDRRPRVTHEVRVRAGGRTLRLLEGESTFGRSRFAGVVCTRASRLRVLAELTDRNGNVSETPARTITVARP